jgi:hypothetical protein
MSDECRDVLVPDEQQQQQQYDETLAPHPLLLDAPLLAVPRDSVLGQAAQRNANVPSGARSSSSVRAPTSTASCNLLTFLLFGLKEFATQRSSLVAPIVSLLRVLVHRCRPGPLRM